jgi:preflagellin peptidase FlaK
VFVPAESLADAPDLLRLLAVPTFAWAAYRDVRTRRVSNRTWLPLAAVGVALLAWDLQSVLGGPASVRRAFALRAAVSLGIVAPLGYLFWRLGGFGGADAKALIALAVAFPTYPVYYLPGAALPLEPSRLGVFSLTVLTNTVLVGLAYPVWLTARNAAAGEFAPRMVVGRRIPARAAVGEYGRLLDSGLDLDALRMYLRWRGCSLAALRAAPAAHRDPASVGATNDPGDGTVGTAPAPESPGTRPVSDGGRIDPEGGDRGPVAVEARSEPAAATRAAGTDAPAAGPVDLVDAEDPWGAAAFLAAVDDDAYGTTPAELRAGLDALTERETVWLTPGLPFLVPMFVGLVVALTYGDLLYALLATLGAI